MPEVGDWLEATEGTLNNAVWGVNNGIVSRAGWQFQWYREDTPIDGATDMRYLVVADDVGNRLRVETIVVDQFWRDSDPIMSDYTDIVT